jgi:hypothetical protein
MLAAPGPSLVEDRRFVHELARRGFLIGPSSRWRPTANRRRTPLVALWVVRKESPRRSETSGLATARCWGTALSIGSRQLLAGAGWCGLGNRLLRDMAACATDRAELVIRQPRCTVLRPAVPSADALPVPDEPALLHRCGWQASQGTNGRGPGSLGSPERIA